MIIFRPHIFGGSLEETMKFVKEFENADEMKKYIYSLYNKEKEHFSMNDIVISDRFITNNDSIGWEDERDVCIKRFSDTDYIKENGVPACIGYCATKYKKIMSQNKIKNSHTLVKKY